MFSLKSLEILVRLRVVFPELLDDILANVTVVFLDLSCHPQLVLRRNGSHLSTLSQQVEDELADISASDRDMLDSAADNVSFGAGYDVRHTISRVYNGTRESTVCDTVGGPGGGKGEHGLNGDVEALDVERLEEDLCGLFTVLWRVKRWFGLQLMIS